MDGSNKIGISLVGSGNGRIPLVFDINDIKKLRDIGVAGILSGTLPSAAQQNGFLSVPLRLMVEEALWLTETGVAFFISGPESVTTAAETVTSSEMERARQELEHSFAEQRVFKRQQHAEKMARLGLSNAEGKETPALLESSLFVEIPSASSLISNEAKRQGNDPAQQQKLWHKLKDGCTNPGDYRVYKALKQQNYFLSPGARFGGRFIAYPGDPLRYHSHMTVQPALDYRRDPLNLLQVVSGGRLGTGVKKLWVVAGVRAHEEQEDIESDVSFFSIEWAGFG
ncbi:LAME_0H05094g1_1 [Lachancea meyersii CBS 8951]|uniref:tRNA-splicing endonuclease subunit Sen34 n=1 Tax=Lachancea meyersii CBS 8951 TaxID=1266667 RepID=A0A1G4KE41_9SACH|nr:LAME_0H05094g1_1 [Lachancea meyersii CBS 8951]